MTFRRWLSAAGTWVCDRCGRVNYDPATSCYNCGAI